MGSTSKDIKEKDKRLLEGVIQKKKKQQKDIILFLVPVTIPIQNKTHKPLVIPLAKKTYKY